MTPLGLNREACAQGLQRYAEALAQLRSSHVSPHDAWLSRDELGRLSFDLDVDIGARDGVRARERMTPVEECMFRNALVRLQRTLKSIDGRDGPEAWRSTIDAALLEVSATVERLRQPWPSRTMPTERAWACCDVEGCCK